MKTKKFDTFFSRYKLGLQKACTIKQAKQAKIKASKQVFQAAENFTNHAYDQLNRILKDSFQEEQKNIEKLSTSKVNRGNKYLEQLEEYQDYFEFIDGDALQKIKKLPSPCANRRKAFS